MTQKRVLLARGGPVDLRRLETALERDERFQLFTATGGGGVLRMCRTELPDLVVLELHLPRRAGHSVCRVITHHLSMHQLKVMVLSGQRKRSVLELTRLVGADDFLPNRFNPAELMDRAAYHLQLRRPSRPHGVLQLVGIDERFRNGHGVPAVDDDYIVGIADNL